MYLKIKSIKSNWLHDLIDLINGTAVHEIFQVVDDEH